MLDLTPRALARLQAMSPARLYSGLVLSLLSVKRNQPGVIHWLERQLGDESVPIENIISHFQDAHTEDQYFTSDHPTAIVLREQIQRALNFRRQQLQNIKRASLAHRN